MKIRITFVLQGRSPKNMNITFRKKSIFEPLLLYDTIWQKEKYSSLQFIISPVTVKSDMGSNSCSAILTDPKDI